MSFPLLQPSAEQAGPVRLKPADITLNALFTELTRARSENQVERGAPRLGTAGGRRADRLLQSLEACAAALEERRLPIPPSLRDELRLRRSLHATSRT